MYRIKIPENFLKKISRFENALIEEINEGVKLLCDPKNHVHLKVHKLKGSLTGTYSFSVNYRIRVIFEYVGKNDILLLDVGNHDIY